MLGHICRVLRREAFPWAGHPQCSESAVYEVDRERFPSTSARVLRNRSRLSSGVTRRALGGLILWRSQPDSNRCTSLERAEKISRVLYGYLRNCGIYRVFLYGCLGFYAVDFGSVWVQE
jgi:hypothetical protein